MNPYLKNLNRIEFLVTLACTGRCKHCSEGEHISDGAHLSGDIAAEAVRKICGEYKIDSLMTFGGEPLLYAEEVYKIHAAAKEMHIPARQLITNGFFSRDKGKISKTAKRLSESGVNSVLLSVDAFHQETIPLEYVKLFAESVKSEGIYIRSHPAWLVSAEDNNPYNNRTREILSEFSSMGISESDGNIIFPSGNALKYLSGYFSPVEEYINPYKENPADMRAVCFSPDGGILGGNINNTDILEIIGNYRPE